MKPSEERGGLEPVAEIAYAGIADTRKLQFVAVKETLPDKTKLYALPPGYAVVPIEPTEEMVEQYLLANAKYWVDHDQLPSPIGKWRSGTAKQATVAGYKAMLATGGKKT
jgi:hypothetical protein